MRIRSGKILGIKTEWGNLSLGFPLPHSNGSLAEVCSRPQVKRLRIEGPVARNANLQSTGSERP